jgi:hypothetical protein
MIVLEFSDTSFWSSVPRWAQALPLESLSHRIAGRITVRPGHGPVTLCVFITAGPITKLCAWGEKDSGGHVL